VKVVNQAAISSLRKEGGNSAATQAVGPPAPKGSFLGVDAEGTPLFCDGNELTKYRKDGGMTKTSFVGITVDEKRDTYISNTRFRENRRMEIAVYHYTMNGTVEVVRLRYPQELWERFRIAWQGEKPEESLSTVRIVSVTSKGELCILDQRLNHVMEFSSTGHYMGYRSLDDYLGAPYHSKAHPAYSVQLPYRYWHIDRKGDVYVPVSDPEGLKIIRFTEVETGVSGGVGDTDAVPVPPSNSSGAAGSGS